MMDFYQVPLIMTNAYPFSKSTRVMYYNQDLLDEYGGDVPKHGMKSLH